jgi:hypothetical protein
VVHLEKFHRVSQTESILVRAIVLSLSPPPLKTLSNLQRPLLMGLKSLDSTVGTKPTTEAQLDSATFKYGMVLQILRSDQFIDGLYVFL